MPYINVGRRVELHKVSEECPETPGELNYVLTEIILDYLDDPDSGNGHVNYEKYNSVIGVLECIKQELFRRRIAPYEDRAKERNGDVYED